MPKSLLELIASIALGCTLALLSIYSANLGGWPTGWIGGLALLGWSLLARKRWVRAAETTGLEPGGPERVLRFHAVGIALLFGHSVTCYAFPDIDIHVGKGNFLAIDSWTMIGAMLLASRIFHQDTKIQDERDVAIKAHGTRVGFLALISFLIIFSMTLAVLPQRYIPTLSYFVLGNMQITIILASLLIKNTAQLIAYAKDTDANFALGTDE